MLLQGAVELVDLQRALHVVHERVGRQVSECRGLAVRREVVGRRVQPQRVRAHRRRVGAQHLRAPHDDLEVDAGAVLPHALRR